MSLLQSGKIYKFLIPFDEEHQKDLSTLRQEFLTKYISTTGITNTDYSTLMSFYSSYEQKTYYYINLPYINDPINTTKGKLFISLCFPTVDIDNNGLFIVGTRGLNGVGGTSYNDPKRYDTRIKLSNNAVVKYKNSSEFNYENNSKFGSNFIPGFNYFRIDTRYLDACGFYTINSLYCETMNEIDKIYFSPTTIICDMEDQITKQHYDAAFALQTNGCMWDLYDQSEYGTENYNMLAGLGIGFDSDNEPQYVNSSFFPQMWGDYNNIQLHRLRFGRLKSNNIYITNVNKEIGNSNFKTLTDYKKMSEYQNEWLTDKIYTENQKFMVGVSGIVNEMGDYGDRSKVKYQFALVTEEYIPEPEPEPIDYALKFSNDTDFTLLAILPNWDGILEYSDDEGKTWTLWNGDQLLGNKNKSIYIRGVGNTKITGPFRGENGGWRFTGKSITGNIETLLDYKKVQKGQHPTMANFCYFGLFLKCTNLLSPPELPSTSLVPHCYRWMFSSCTSLVEAPKLPALTLATECYHDMFSSCTSLKKAPELPATTLANGCYVYMFNECTSLIKISKLPATTLVNNCYNGMYRMCTSLKELPKLPATTLKTECYRNMFYGCRSLKISRTKNGIYQNDYRIPIVGSGQTASYALSNMFYGTGGSFTGTPSINTTYYTDCEPV